MSALLLPLVSNSFRYIICNEISRLYCSFMFNPWRNHQTYFHSSCIITFPLTTETHLFPFFFLLLSGAIIAGSLAIILTPSFTVSFYHTCNTIRTAWQQLQVITSFQVQIFLAVPFRTCFQLLLFVCFFSCLQFLRQVSLCSPNWLGTHYLLCRPG